MTMLSAGVAEAIITPPVGVEPIEPRGARSTGIHDDLFARALSLGDGTTTLVVVGMDLLGLDPDLVDQARDAVWKRARVPAERLMLTSTHNHCAPVTISWGRSAQERRDREWEGRLVDAIADVVTRSLQVMHPATVAAGRAPVQIGLNRRLATVDDTMMMPNPEGPVSPWVDVLRVDRTEGGPLALLFTHAAHAVTVHTTGTEFSAEFPGFAVQAIRQKMGQGVMPLFAQGCCGDINVDPLRGGYAEAERVGGVLGDAAVRAAQAAEPIPAAPLSYAVKQVFLPFEPLDPSTIAEILSRAREGQRVLAAQKAADGAMYNQRELVLWAERMQKITESGETLRGLPFEVQGFALGDGIALLGLTHEVFVDYQLFLQAQSPFPRTMVFAYTNGCGDYVPTADAFTLGGYEVRIAHKHYGWPELQPDCDRIVRETGLAVLEELFGAPG